jgi:hypothetical protein
MRPTAVRVILVACSAGLLGGCKDAAKQNAGEVTPAAEENVQACQRSLGHCTKQVPCEVTVQLQPDANKKCQVTSLSPPDPRNVPLDRHRIRVCVGDPVTWTFDNQCDEELQLEIRHFHIDRPLIREREAQGIDVTKELRDPVPFADLTSVRVSAGQRGSLKAVAKINYDARTYKYDILQTGSCGTCILLDPEIEIYR